MVSGITFGLAYELIFMAMLNYLSDAYQIFAASAQSAASCCRSIWGAVLPLAAQPMFSAVGIDWGCSIIAFVSLGVSVIPFAFIYFGDKIRRGSKMQRHLQAMKEEEERAWAQEAAGAGDNNNNTNLTSGTTGGVQDAEKSVRMTVATAQADADTDIEKQAGRV